MTSSQGSPEGMRSALHLNLEIQNGKVRCRRVGCGPKSGPRTIFENLRRKAGNAEPPPEQIMQESK